MKPMHLLMPLMLGLCSMAALAAATVTDSAGEVRIRAADGTLSAGAVGARVLEGATVLTGPNARAAMRFDDGQIIGLEKDTEFKVESFRYNAAQPASGNVFLSMVKGSLRAITGLIGRNNKQAFRLTTPTATIGIRGSDWMAALLNNSLYTGVTSNGISITNGANTLLVDAGQYSATLGVNASQLVSFSQLPANVFGSLPNLSIGGANWAGDVAGGASSGGGSVAGTAGASGLSGGMIAAGVAVAGAIAATSNDNGSTTTHATPSHH
ncbi:FecR family protein [Chitinimonas koreensis]|uniref:FecR family protein n=1 Tax=Chitinimonas koreensis TaxID=356302 RepID=UPI000415397B|nr:FecR family protein [Chitinimonas koreensis]QNM96250.1 FecR domain-containing protein [Chitinimonas koreensis]